MLWFGWLEHLESVMDFLLVFFLPWWVQVKFDNIRAPFNEMRRGCSPFYFQVHHILKDQHHLSSYMYIVFTLNWKTVIVLQKVRIYSQVTRLLFIYKTHHIFFFKRSFMQLNLDFKKRGIDSELKFIPWNHKQKWH